MHRIFDLLLLLLFLPLLGPIFLLVVALAMVFHGKKIFFIQQRVGKHQRPFKLYKFRSMIEGAQNMGTGFNSYKDDFRITPFGKFLRTTSLDEFPQIINVALGDMSFVGPRPPVVGELELENDLPPYTAERFLVRPGLTGWAQIHGRDHLKWSQKIEYDITFVRAQTVKRFLLCCYILAFTPLYLLNFSATYEKK